MAAPAYGSAGAPVVGAFSTAANLSVPPGVAANDVILAYLYVESIDTVTPPAGLTEVPDSPVIVTGAEAHRLRIYWKRATGNDTGTYNFTVPLAWRSGIAIRYTGVVTSGNPFDVTAPAAKTTNTDGTTPAVSDTTTGSDRLWLWSASSYNGGTCTTPTGFTERADLNTGNGLAVGDMMQASAGSSGSVTATFSANSATAAWLGALLPAASSPPQGSAAVTYGWSLSATGGRTPTAAATITHTWSVSAAGQTPSAASGAAAITYGWATSSAGNREPLAAAIITYTWATSALGQSPSVLPYLTAVAGNGRYFIDQHGEPFQVRGDSPWSAMVHLTTPTLVDAYVEARAAQGYNTMIMSAIVGDIGNGGQPSGETSDGVTPFTTGLTFRETYWARLDYLLTKCRDEGITVLLYAMDVWNTGLIGDGPFTGATTTQAFDYGVAIATRYANTTTYPNIVWMVGGDWFASSSAALGNLLESCLDGIQSVDSTRLCSAQVIEAAPSNLTYGNSFSIDRGADWEGKLDWSFVYDWVCSYNEVLIGYQHSWPTTGSGNTNLRRPALASEPRYWNEYSSPEWSHRRQIAWAYVAGSPGDIWGTEDWQFWGGWESRLNIAIHTELGALRDWFAAMPWHLLVPDETLITSGAGTRTSHATLQYPEDNTYALGAVASTGMLAVIYVPSARTIGVDTSKVTGASSAKWIDPVSAAETPAVFGSSFTTPGTNSGGETDWLLLIEGGTPLGGASCTYTWAVAGAGERDPHASAAASFSWTLAASGHRAPAAGAAVGVSWSVASSGRRDPEAAAAVTFGWAVTGTGRGEPRATATITYTWAVAGVGSTPNEQDIPEGVASIGYGWDVAATGDRFPTAAASVTFGWAMSAVGDRVDIDIPEGAAALTYTWSVMVGGHRAPKTTATVTLTWAIAAAGHSAPTATATITYGWVMGQGLGGIVAPPQNRVRVRGESRRTRV